MDKSYPTLIRGSSTCAWLGAVALAAAVLTGCGGGGTAAPPQTPAATDGDVPVTALASTMAFAQYVGAQTSDDKRAPLALGPMPAPVSDTEAPITVQ